MTRVLFPVSQPVPARAQEATCVSPTLCAVAGAGRAQCAHPTGCLAEPSCPSVAQQPPLSPCRTGTAHSSVQVPEERQSDVLWPEDHEEGNLCCRPASHRASPSSLQLPSPCNAAASVPSETVSQCGEMEASSACVLGHSMSWLPCCSRGPAEMWTREGLPCQHRSPRGE